MAKKGEKLSIRTRKKIGINHADISGHKNPRWKGGRMYTSSGYVLIHQPNHPFVTKMGYVREHRLVMEKCIGRFLTEEENIHHINGIKDDNRVENLLLMTRAEHTSLEMRGKDNPNYKHGKYVKKFELLLYKS